jgi:hypothetical protein
MDRPNVRHGSLRHGPTRPPEDGGDLTGRERVERVIPAPSDRSLASRATAHGGSDGATVATLATTLARVPTNQTRRPRAKGADARMRGRTAERKDEQHGPNGLSGTPGTGRREAYPRRGASRL